MTAGSDLPFVSMIVPTYQRRDMVCETVEAIGRIRYAGRFELVVIIDGSDDGTEEALRRIALPFPYRIIWQPNGGLGHARNRGAAEAGGDILFFLDDDMICTPNLVSEHVKSHLAGADAVNGDIPLDGSSPPGFLTQGIAAWSENSAQVTAHADKLRPFHIFGGQFSVRRDVFFELGGFDPTFTSNGNYGQEDADFGVRLLRKHTARFNPDAISFHRYIVTPRENMRRSFRAGRSDMMFIRRYPSLARELFEYHKIDSRNVRYILRPIASLPLVPRMIAGLAWRFAAVALRTPLRDNRLVARMYYAGQQIAYWSSIRRHGHGFPDARTAHVLCYHAIADHPDDPTLATYSISPDAFVQQLDQLLDEGFTFVSATDFLACLRGRIRLPRRSILLTFDDCYIDLLDAARTILRPRRIPALAFAVTGMRSGTNEWDQKAGVRKLELLDGEGLQELRALDVEIGAHSRTHRIMAGLSATDLERETRGCVDDFAAMGLPRPRFFAYPHGVCDPRVMAAVDSAGFELGFSLAVNDVKPHRNFFDIQRVQLVSSDTGWRYRAKTRAARAYYLAGRVVRRIIGSRSA